MILGGEIMHGTHRPVRSVLYMCQIEYLSGKIKVREMPGLEVRINHNWNAVEMTGGKSH
jgi:hypothetical protein